MSSDRIHLSKDLTPVQFVKRHLVTVKYLDIGGPDLAPGSKKD